MLLSLVKYSRPDIANSVRELSKCMMKATADGMKELKRVLKFVIDTKTLGLRMAPEKQPTGNLAWEVVVYSDADWAGDKDTRRSITGFVIFVLGCPVCWRSRAQKSVSLSSAESEWYALSEAAKEVKFIAQLLMSMDIPVQLPIVVKVDNIGAIFMSENTTTTGRTKHIDLRMRFVGEFCEEGFIKVIFVKSEDNLSDGFTKNQSGELYEAHAGSIVAEKNYLD